MVSQNVSHVGSSHQIRDLEPFADRYSIPWNLPTNFHPDLIQYGRGTFFHSAYCSLRNPICFRSVWCSTCHDSRKDLHRPCQIPRNCQCAWLLVSCSAPRILQAPFFVFPERFLFCTDTTGSTGKPSPAPRMNNRWFFEIHNLHWRTLWSAVIKSPKFSARGTAPPLRLLHRGSCNFGPLADLAISVFREVSINTVFTPNPHFSQA